MCGVPTATWERLTTDRREGVLRAAQREFGRHGFSGASMNTIARDAGVAKGSLFQYFDDKLELYVHLGEVASRRIRSSMEIAVAGLPWETDFFGAVREVLLVWEEYFHSHPHELGMTAAVNLEPDETARAAIRDVVHPHYLGVITPLVERGVAGGSLREDADQEALTAMLLLLLPHIALAPHREGLDPVLGLGSPAAVVRRQAVERAVDVLRRAFGAPA